MAHLSSHLYNISNKNRGSSKQAGHTCVRAAVFSHKSMLSPRRRIFRTRALQVGFLNQMEEIPLEGSTLKVCTTADVLLGGSHLVSV